MTNKLFKSSNNTCSSIYSIQFISTIPNACTTKIYQFMKYSYVRESPWYNIKIKYTGCQIYSIYSVKLTELGAYLDA